MEEGGGGSSSILGFNSQVSIDLTVTNADNVQ
jgi:hypothetical protein